MRMITPNGYDWRIFHGDRQEEYQQHKNYKELTNYMLYPLHGHLLLPPVSRGGGRSQQPVRSSVVDKMFKNFFGLSD